MGNDNFIRFITPQINEESGYNSGLFMAAWDVHHADETHAFHREQLATILRWFGRNLNEPERFWRSNSKGADRRNWRGLSWYKTSSVDHIGKMYEMAFILSEYGYAHSTIVTSKPGFIVYEDRNQVVAEPFSETPTA